MTIATKVPPDDHGHPPELKSPVVLDFKTSADRELEDLVYSWKRVADPKLRKIALGIIRSMATDAY